MKIYTLCNDTGLWHLVAEDSAGPAIIILPGGSSQSCHTKMKTMNEKEVFSMKIE